MNLPEEENNDIEDKVVEDIEVEDIVV